MGSITSGKGDAGEIIIEAEEIILQNRGGIGIDTKSEGNAGKLTINTSLLQLENSRVQDHAGINSSSNGSGKAGELVINADKILFDKSDIRAETESGRGGNITLNLNEILLLRNGSHISTAAGTVSGGGNGGNINITTQNIFGLAFRDTKTDQSDITASSEFGINGMVEINNVNIDPNSGLVELPSELTDSSQQIAQGCSSGSDNSFVAIGKAGIPQNPQQYINKSKTINFR